MPKRKAKTPPPSMQSRSSRAIYARSVWIALSGVFAAALTAWMLSNSLRVRMDRTVVPSLRPDLASGPGQENDAYQGWARPAGPGLWLAPSSQGRIGFRVHIDPGERVALSLRVRNDSRVRTQVVLQPGDKSFRFLEVPEAAAEKPIVEIRRDLTESLGGVYYFYLTLDCRCGPGGTDSALAVESVHFNIVGRMPPRVRVGSCLFFSALCFMCWWTFFGWIVPWGLEGMWALSGLLDRWGKSGALRRTMFGAMLVATIFLGLRIVVAPVWLTPKTHDDRWALSNSRLLAVRRFHTEDVFFRSRVRPGFGASMLPMQSTLAHDLATLSYSISDFHKRMFYVFDRRDETWGSRLYPEASILGIVFALAAWALTSRLALRFATPRSGPLRAVLTLLFAAWFLRRILDSTMVSPISLAATWLYMTVPIVAFALTAHEPKARGRWAFAGLLAGIAALFKESAVTVFLPIALYQIRLYAMRPRLRHALSYAVLLFWVCAAAPLLIYYSSVIDGGFAEISDNLASHVKSIEILKDYEKAGLVGAFRTLWLAFGWGLPLALAGIVLELRPRRRPRGRTWFYLFWLIGCSTVFTLPYFYARFLIYMIPALAWFAAGAIVQVPTLRRRQKRT